MTDQLKDLLLEYLGEIKLDKESCFNWIEKDELIRKERAINTLLGFDNAPENTFVEKLNEFILNNRP